MSSGTSSSTTPSIDLPLAPAAVPCGSAQAIVYKRSIALVVALAGLAFALAYLSAALAPKDGAASALAAGLRLGEQSVLGVLLLVLLAQAWCLRRAATERTKDGRSGSAVPPVGLPETLTPASIPPSPLPGTVAPDEAEAARRFALVAEHIGSAVAFTDGNRNITWVNRAFTVITGYSAAEAIGRSPAFLQGPGSDSTLIAALNSAVAAGTPFRGEMLHRSKDGSPYWAEIELHPHLSPEKKLLGFIELQTDITARKGADLNMRTSLDAAERANHLLENAGRIARLGNWEIFCDDRPPLWSPMTYEIHDIVMKRRISFEEMIRFYAPHHRQRVQAQIDCTLATGEPFEFEAELVTAAQRNVWVHCLGVAVRAPDGTITGALGVIQDITDRRSAEKMIREREARFATLSRHVPGVIYQFRLTAAGVPGFEYASEGSERVWGLTPEVATSPGFPCRNLVHIEDRALLGKAIHVSAATLGPFEVTHRHHHPTLGLRWVHSSSSPVREANGDTVWHGYACDITDLVVAQESLRGNEERLRAIVEHLPLSVLLKDAEGRWLLINQAGLATVGLRHLDWKGRNDAELYADRPELAADLARWQATDEEAWRAGAPISFEETLPSISRTFDVTKVPLFHPDGSRRGIIVISSDITSRKQAADLVDRERRLFAAGPVAVLVTTPEPGWPITYVSENIFGLLGYTASQLRVARLHYAELIHPEDLPAVVADTQARLAAFSPHYESSYRLRHCDGTYRWFYEFTSPEYSPARVCVSSRSYLFDQTQLKQAQDELRVREEQIAAITQHVPGVLYEFKRLPGGGCFPYASAGLRDVFAVAPEEVRTDGAAFFRRVHPEDTQGLDCAISEAHARCQEWRYEFRIIHPQNGLRWINGSSSPRRLEDGGYVWDGYLFDITDRKNAEQHLLHEGKREAIERLAGGVAHDFNNYLASIALSADLLNSLPEASPRIREITATLAAEVDAATGVARQLLAFTKDQPVQSEHLVLADFLRHCAGFALRGSAMTATVAVTDPTLTLGTDPDLLRQILFNLILNSRQAMHDKGSVALSAQADAAGIITIRIADSGPGIPACARNNIFEPYFTTKSSGSGLGLFVVRSLIRRLGGDIQLDLTATQGAVFLLTLPPLSSAPATSPTPDTRPPLLSTALKIPSVRLSAKHHVLLLEDEPGQTMLLKGFFESVGVGVDCFSDGDALLAAAPAHRSRAAHLICLLDISVRGSRGGVDIAPALRRLLPDARISLVSGYSSEWEEREASLAGLNVSFIGKPYHLRELKAHLFGQPAPSPLTKSAEPERCRLGE